MKPTAEVGPGGYMLESRTLAGNLSTHDCLSYASA
jgi:hypothetical protein